MIEGRVVDVLIQYLRRVDEMNQLGSIIPSRRTELLDLFSDYSHTSVLVSDTLPLVDDDENVRLFSRCVPEEFLCGESEMILCRDDKDDHVDFCLSSKERGRGEGVAIQSRRVDEGNRDETIFDERGIAGVGGRGNGRENDAGSSSVGDIRLEELVSATCFIVLDRIDLLQLERFVRRSIRRIVRLDVLDCVNLLPATVVRLGVENFAEYSRAGLLVRRHDISSEERVDEGRLSGVQISRNEDSRGRVDDSGAESGEMSEGGREAAGEELRESSEGEGGQKSG